MNKKANISTFIFVMLVLVTCIVAAGYFLVNSKNIVKEVSDVSNPINLMLNREKGNFYLQEISREAIIKSYSETIKDLSQIKDLSSNGNSLSVQVLSENFTENENKYRTNFVFHLKNNLITITNYYSFLEDNEQIKNLLAEPEVNFDGNNIEIILKGYSLTLLNGQVNSTYFGDLSFKTNLEREGLLSANHFYSISSLCPSADEKCIQINLPNFDVAKGGITSISINSESHHLVHLISKESFFVQGNSLEPEVYLII